MSEDNYPVETIENSEVGSEENSDECDVEATLDNDNDLTEEEKEWKKEIESESKRVIRRQSTFMYPSLFDNEPPFADNSEKIK